MKAIKRSDVKPGWIFGTIPSQINLIAIDPADPYVKRFGLSSRSTNFHVCPNGRISWCWSDSEVWIDQRHITIEPCSKKTAICTCGSLAVGRDGLCHKCSTAKRESNARKQELNR